MGFGFIPFKLCFLVNVVYFIFGAYLGYSSFLNFLWDGWISILNGFSFEFV